MMLRTILAALATTFALSAPAPATAQVMTDVSKLSIRSGWSEGATRHIAALQIDLAPGWKTYWRQPGDVGIPAVFNWSGSENVRSVEVLWPRPQVSFDYGMRSLGYDTQVVLPIVVTTKAGGPIKLKGRVMFGVCEDVCIPVEYKFDAKIARGSTSDRAIQAAIDAQPRLKNVKVTCSFSPYKSGLQATLTLQTPRLGATEHMAVEFSDPDLWVGVPTLQRTANTLTAQVKILANNGKRPLIDRAGVRTTLIAGPNAIEIRGCQAR